MSILSQMVLASLGSAAGGGGSGVAAPTLTGSPTLVASWDFDNTSTITLSGSDIDQITGADSTSYTLTSPGNMPNQELRGGKYAARFTSASTEYLSLEGSAVMGDTSDGASTIVVIGEFASVAASGSLAGFCQKAATINAVSSWIYGSAGATAMIGRRVTGNAQADAGTYTAGDKKLAILTQETGTGVAKLYLNGTSTPVTSPSVAQATSNDAFYVGAIQYSSTIQAYLDGWVWRVLVYSATLDATQVEEIATWAAANYGTPNNA